MNKICFALQACIYADCMLSTDCCSSRDRASEKIVLKSERRETWSADGRRCTEEKIKNACLSRLLCSSFHLKSQVCHAPRYSAVVVRTWTHTHTPTCAILFTSFVQNYFWRSVFRVIIPFQWRRRRRRCIENEANSMCFTCENIKQNIASIRIRGRQRRQVHFMHASKSSVIMYSYYSNRLHFCELLPAACTQFERVRSLSTQAHT